MRRSLRRRSAVLPLVTLAVLGACGDDGAASPCLPAVQEALDPGSLLHVLPDSDVAYTTDPPTSGPHAGAAPTGAVPETLPAPVQVAVLERGDVLVQYDPSLDADQVAYLERLPEGDEPVVVAPNPGLPAPIVATAWQWKLTCEAVDLDTLDRFVADHAARHSGH